MYRSTSILFGAALLGGVHAATADPQTNVATASPAPSAPSSLVLYFTPGSATVRQQDVALLDQASRLYRAGHPIVLRLHDIAPQPGTIEITVPTPTIGGNRPSLR